MVSRQIANYIGCRFTIMGALVISFASITVRVFAYNNPIFFGGKFLNGFAVGTLKVVSTTYIGETAPVQLRGLMTCLIGLGYTIGPFCVALILNELELLTMLGPTAPSSSRNTALLVSLRSSSFLCRNLPGGLLQRDVK